MALALDASSGNRQSAVGPLTWAHTVSGSNTILVMGFFTDNSTTATATFNGTSMTGLTPLVCEANTVLIPFYLINPDAGTHNIVVTYSNSADVAGMAQSWTGAKQSGQFDNSATNTAGSGTTTGTVVTVADNCVCMAWFRENQPSTNWSAGTNSTTIPNTNSGGLEAADFFGGYYTNFAVTPAGSVSMSASCTGNQGNVYIVSIAPFVSTSSIKTVDGLAKASVKTVDGLAIASVKTWNGLA